MAEELDILRVIAENPNVSQRKIAQQTSISLGQVNFLIKKCVKKGLVKIEGQTTKSIQYNLTPMGMAEKAAKTLQYIKASYGAVVALTNKIKALTKQHEDRKICVYGENDEMMEICKLALGDNARYINVFTEREEKEGNELYLYWDEKYGKMSMAQQAGKDNHLWINILE